MTQPSVAKIKYGQGINIQTKPLLFDNLRFLKIKPIMENMLECKINLINPTSK